MPSSAELLRTARAAAARADARHREAEVAARTAMAALQEAKRAKDDARARVRELEAAAPVAPPTPADDAPGAQQMDALEALASRWSPPPSLLVELRDAANHVVTMESSPVSLLQTVARAADAGGACVTGAGAADGPEGEWHWLLIPSDAVVRAPPAPGRKLAPPEADGSALLICVGHNASGALRGALGWVDDAALASPSELQPSAVRCLARLDDDSIDSYVSMHVSVQGVGRGGVRPVPVGLSTCTSVVGHLCVAVREADVARRQVRARLQMAEADDDEAAHTEKLLDISARRLDGALFFADAAEALPQDVEKIEAAVQGLRKCWLRRPLCPRCDRCGVRHEDIEFSTCRFWQEWAAYDDVQAAATDSE